MANIRQVAELAGVSPITVSRVLGGPKGQFPVTAATKRKVQDAAAQLGYHVNYHMQAISTGRANVTGFTIETTLDQQIGSGIGNTYFDALRRGVEYTTQEAGAAVLSVHPGKGLSAIARGIGYLQTRRLDALIAPGSLRIAQQVEEYADSPSLPLVLVNPLEPIHRPSITFDQKTACHLIAKHLAELGHRRVLWLGPADREHGPQAVDRLEYLEQIAPEAGLTIETCLVRRQYPQLHNVPDAVLGFAGESLLGQLDKSPRRWTALVAFSDIYAIGACRALVSRSISVPHDVSVIGFDNSIASFATPPLTTIDHCFFEMGQRAGGLAARLINMNKDERKQLLGYEETVLPKLVVRESTAPVQSPNT